MPAVDLNKNKDSIVKAHKEVSDPSNKTNWALFGYDGQTDVLKLVSKGDGGIEELLEDLSGGKIMYAYIKVIDPNSNLPKFVFVNWQGEGVPEVRKGACANHVRDVQTLLRGAHVSINARTEDEVDEKVILSKVSKASGSNYSFHKEEKKAMPAIEPVGSVYQKVRPQIEIKPDVKQSFWEASEHEEKQRILLEKQQAAKDRAKLDKEIKDREEKEAKAREQRENERVKKIREVQDAQKRADTDSSTGKGNYNAADAVRDEEERARRSEEMRKNRAAEAKALVSGRANEARSVFEQKPSSQFDQPARDQAPTRKLKHAFLDGSDQQSEPSGRKQPIQLPKDEPQTSVVPQPRAPAPPKAVVREPEPETYEDDLSTPNTVTTPSSGGPQIKNLLAQGMPRRQPESDDEQEEDQSWDEPSEYPHHSNTSSHVAAQEPDEELYDDTSATEHHHGDEGDVYQDTAADGSKGVCARALYDYQAAEENEISFDPDNIITNIEMIDEGWWLGTGPDGKHGMFPSNFVELF